MKPATLREGDAMNGKSVIKLALIAFVAAIVLVSLTGCGSGEYSTVKARGAYTHSRTDMKFPEVVGQFKRARVRVRDAEGLDICVHYGLARGDLRIPLSVYLFPVPSGYVHGSSVLEREFAKVELKVPAFDSTAKVCAEGEGKIVQGASVFHGRFAKFMSERGFGVFDEAAYSTKYVFVRSTWAIEYLSTYPCSLGDGEVRDITQFMELLKWPKALSEERGDYTVSVTELVEGEWKRGTVTIDGKSCPYDFLEVTESPDYSKVSEPDPVRTDDPLLLVADVIYYFSSADADNLKRYCVKGDACERLASEDVRQIWEPMDKPQSRWIMTHMIAYDGFLFLKGSRRDASSQKDSVDLWVFSREDGSWKLNLLNECYAKVKWFERLLYDETLELP